MFFEAPQQCLRNQALQKAVACLPRAYEPSAARPCPRPGYVLYEPRGVNFWSAPTSAVRVFLGATSAAAGFS